MPARYKATLVVLRPDDYVRFRRMACHPIAQELSTVLAHLRLGRVFDLPANIDDKMLVGVLDPWAGP